ncbi:MAG: hypothetical protein E6J91_28780 [Deltaproteobacteria bacterium]|nr:MAG: hypothetical protein E6J91_28780 [Deltaproteobacteria bacterium]
MRNALAVALVAMAACAGDLDPPWQLDHDRIIAVRATPPAITAGQTATIDALLAHKGSGTSMAAPELATVVSPAGLADVLSIRAGNWVVTAPGEDRLAAARSELQLAPGGATADNPRIAGVTVDGKPPGDTAIVVGKLVKVPLAIDADDAVFDVAWLTSCGTMHDFDLPQAYLKVETDDPDAGELGVVLRDAHGGVAWQLWSIRAE